MVQVIPDVPVWSPPQVDRGTLNDSQSRISEVQLATCAANLPLRFGYGRQRLGAQWLRPIVGDGYLHLPFIIAAGPIQEVESIEFGQHEAQDGITTQVYLGTTGQAVDPWLAAAWGAVGSPYIDTLDGIAWGVLRIAGWVPSFPTDVTITAKLRKVYDPRKKGQNPNNSATWTYSANPALALADFLASPAYGRGETVDWDSVREAAAICDETVGTGKRREFGLIFDTVQNVQAIEDVLRTYAGCWVVREGGTTRLVPDAPASPVFAFDQSNVLLDTIRISQRKRADNPTVVSVVWTDTTVKPWAARTHTEATPGVVAGTVEWREEAVQLPGIQDASWARREALRRLNAYIAADLTVNLTAVGDAIALRRGDVVTLTDSEGMTAKQFRVTDHAPQGLGLWAETLAEYDAEVYSDDVVEGPSTPDTSYPLPTDPPALSSLAAVEETYALQSGIFASRLRITWTAPTYPFLSGIAITVRVGTAVAANTQVSASATGWTTPPLQEGQTYTVEASIVSTVGAIGPALTTLAPVAGKALPPGNVPSIDGFEVGGRVFLTWQRADNPTVPGTPDPDVWRYEVRRSAPGGTWAAATVIDQIDALRIVDEGAPAGTWRYHVKAIDSVDQYSATAATRDIVVTVDSNAFLVDSADQVSPTLTNMESYRLAPTDPATYYVTEDGVAWGTKFSSALSTYTDALATYHSSLTSTWLGEAEDFGELLGGQWTGTATVEALSGSISSSLGHSTDNVTWTYPAGLSQKVNARYARLKHEATGTATLRVTVPMQQIRIDAIPREEVGTGTSSDSGPVTVTLANVYVAVKKLMISPEGSTAAMALYDNVVTGDPTTFDVYIFDTAGTKVARNFRYAFQGV